MIAVYDLKVSPPTFDFTGFLISAERARILRGARGMQIVIVPGPNHGFRQDHLPPHDPAERRRMLDNIVKPMCKLLPSVISVEEKTAEEVGIADFPFGWAAHRRYPHYGTDKMAQAWKADCFPLTAGPVKKNEDLVTITLRDTYHPTRNSNRPAWAKLAAQLWSVGKRVRVIGQDDLPNAYARAGVYASAGLNLFVNNGPAWMAAAMRDVPCIIFKMCAKGAPCVSPSFFEGIGFPVGSQIGRKGHRIVWKDDEEETLIEETMNTLQEMAYG